MKTLKLYDFVQKLSTFEQVLHLEGTTTLTIFRIRSQSQNEVGIMVFVRDSVPMRYLQLHLNMGVSVTGLHSCAFIPINLFTSVKTQIIEDVQKSFQQMKHKLKSKGGL